jgi:hypothetical protein
MTEIEAIKGDLKDVIDRLDALMAGKSVNAGYLIERGIGQLESFIRDELDVIQEAIK